MAAFVTLTFPFYNDSTCKSHAMVLKMTQRPRRSGRADIGYRSSEDEHEEGCVLFAVASQKQKFWSAVDPRSRSRKVFESIPFIFEF